MSLPRLKKEREELEKEGFNVIQENDTLWKIYIAGPQQTPFFGGQFEVQFKLDNFPFKAPIVSFVSKIYHPNVDEKGDICAEMLQTSNDKWLPTKKMVKVMEKIQSLMIAPNLDSPVNNQAAQDYKNGTWFAKAQAMTTQHAK